MEEEEEEGWTLNKDGMSVGNRNGFRLVLPLDRRNKHRQT